MEGEKTFHQKQTTPNLSQRPAPAQTAPAREQSIEFSLYAPQARSVSVAGTFNRWNPVALSLKKDLQGNWRGSTSLKPGRYQYRFYIDGKWADDPKAKQTVPNEFGTRNAIVEVK